jgi:hypothetical protein
MLSANVKQAETAFNDYKYQEAIPFEALLKENKTAELQYYLGVALLETDKIKSSQSCFNDKIRNSIYKTKYI